MEQRLNCKIFNFSTESYVSELPVLQSHHRRDSEVPKLMSLLNKGGGPHGHERPLTQLLRIVTKAQPADFHCMLSMDTLGVIARLVQEGSEANAEVSRKAVILAVQLYRNICSVCPQLTRHAILGNSICTLLDVLYAALQVGRVGGFRGWERMMVVGNCLLTYLIQCRFRMRPQTDSPWSCLRS